MKKFIVFIALMLSIVLLVAGCSSDSNENIQEADNIENQEDLVDEDNDALGEEEEQDDIDEEDIAEEDSDTEDDSSSLLDIFEKTDKMESYYYELDTNLSDGASYTTKIWIAKDKMKMESYYPENDETIIMIIDSEEGITYMYTPKENMAIKMDNDESSLIDEDASQSSQDYIDLMRELADDGSVNVENGRFNGESVKIISGDMYGSTNKMWISTKNGLPLKSEFYTDGELESSSLMKNFEEKSIDSSIFTIPEGTEIMDLTEELESIED